MPSRTEQALIALTGKVAAIAAANNSVLPGPNRNEELPDRLLTVADGVDAFLNVLDGDGSPEGGDGDTSGETLGADVVEGGYEVLHRAEIEWIVSASTPADRDAKFDAGLVAIYDGLRDDRTLGGVVSFITVEKVQRSNLSTEGLPHLKSASITVAISFLSGRPF